jgi:hypothetical protein
MHQPPSLIEEIAAAIGGFNFVGQRVGERVFGYFAREVCALGRSVAERGAEAMDRKVRAAHAL